VREMVRDGAGLGVRGNGERKGLAVGERRRGVTVSSGCFVLTSTLNLSQRHLSHSSKSPYMLDSIGIHYSFCR